MQIREQGKKIQLIRTHYIKEKKRTEGKVFASFPRYEAKIPADIISQLEKEEVDKLDNYLSERKENNRVNSAKFSLSHAHNSISRVIESLSVEEAKNNLSSDEARQIYEEMALLAKALRKAGFKRPVKAANKPAPKTDENQTDIVDLANNKS